ncbi:UNVERIFIED_CONTAM: hypothetical protein B566_EDAN019527, partial [Ephemera danica]
MYPRILPSQLLDITDVIESCPRQCIAHNHKRRQSHAWRRLAVPGEYLDMLHQLESLQLSGHYEDSMPTIPRIYMELFAVVCIETSHYVAFVKGGSGPDAPWVFFDSMADRRGKATSQTLHFWQTL